MSKGEAAVFLEFSGQNLYFLQGPWLPHTVSGLATAMCSRGTRKWLSKLPLGPCPAFWI